MNDATRGLKSACFSPDSLSVAGAAHLVRWRGIAAFFLAACAAVLLIGTICDHPSAECKVPIYVRNGEALIHGIAVPSISWSMPAFVLPNALLSHHVSPAFAALAQGAVLIACAVLVFGLGTLLHSGICGGLAALIFSAVPPDRAFGDRWFYTLFVLFVAYVAVWRVQAPSRWRTLLLAVAVGMSLLVLSPLFLFPFVLAAAEWLWRRPRGGEGSRTGLRQAGLLCAVPFVLLIPWVLMNWQVHHRFILFEHERARCNMISGALGFVHTIRAMDAADPGVPDDRLASWAAGEVIRHPFRYLGAYARRVAFLVSISPILFALSLFGAWLYRERDGHRQLALIVAYYIGIHCVMSVEERYLDPVFPLLAVLAACGATWWLRPARARSGGRFESGLVYAVFLPLLAFQLYALALVAAYPRRAAQGQGLERELAKYPGEAWLWSERGMSGLGLGRGAQAASDLGRAWILDPQPESQARYLWALLVRGRPVWDQLKRAEPADPDGSPLFWRPLLDLAGAAVRSGDRAPAMALLAQARRLKLGAEELGRAAIVYQGLKEYRLALGILDRLVREHPGQSRWRNDRGVLEFLMHRSEEADKDFNAAISLDPGFLPPYLSLGALYVSSGRRAEALRLYEQAMGQAASPHDGNVLVLIAVEHQKLLGGAGVSRRAKIVQ